MIGVKDGPEFRDAVAMMQPRDLLIWDMIRPVHGYSAYLRNANRDASGRVYRSFTYLRQLFVVRVI